jgi:hypothetical protein
MFCGSGLVFGGTEGVGSRFHVLWVWNCFRQYRGRRVPFSCFARPNSFFWVPRASGPVFMFCAPGLVFGGTEDVRSRFHVLRVQNRFRRYRGRRVPFSCFACPDTFSAVPRSEGVRSRIHVLHSRTRFRWCRVRRVSWSLFHVLRARTRFLRVRTRFLRYRGRRVPFSCFVRPGSFSVVSTTSGPFFIFCTPGFVFGGTEGVGSRNHVLCARTRFRRHRGRHVPFSCFAGPESF